MASENYDHFEKDNAYLLSRFEEIIGKVEQLKAQNKSLQKQLIGVEYTNENFAKEILSLKKNNSILKSEISNLKNNLDKEKILIPQNFKIKNKIVKIVSDIEDKEIHPDNLKELLGLLINEIDYCISQLEK